MDYNLAKGIAPGKIIDYELKKRKISQREFARLINMHNQTLNAIIKNHRKLTIGMALDIEKALDMPEGTLLMLQVYYSIEEYKMQLASNSKESNRPNLRKILFWDTDYTRLDWAKQKDAIIRRVKSRGNDREKYEIEAYYKISLRDYL